MGRPIVNHTGEVFGKLTIIGNGYSDGKNRIVEVRCECGNVKNVTYGNLIGGHYVSCGCYIRSLMKLQQTPRHGMTGTPEYLAWVEIRSRCSDPQNPHYGARGIKVCERWLESFENFYADMGPKPKPYRRHSIERRNNNLGYSPDNCYWATLEQQGRNKRNNRLITARGKTQTLVEWSEEMGLKESAIQERLRRGWNEEESVLIPNFGSRKFFHRNR